MGIAPPPVPVVVGPRRSAALRTPLGRSPVGRPPSGSKVLAGRVKLVSPAPGYPAPTAPAPPPRLPAAPPPAPRGPPRAPVAASAAAFCDVIPERPPVKFCSRPVKLWVPLLRAWVGPLAASCSGWVAPWNKPCAAPMNDCSGSVAPETGAAACPAASPSADGACVALSAADWATVSTGSAGANPAGVIGGGVDTIELVSVFSAVAYVRPTFMFCGVKFPQYISSFATIAGVLQPQILLAYNAAVSSRLVWQTIAGITADLATVLASTAACPIATCFRQCAASCSSPRKLSSLPFMPYAAPPTPIHWLRVAPMFATDIPIDSSCWIASASQAAILATIVDGSLASRRAATLSGGPNHSGSGMSSC